MMHQDDKFTSPNALSDFVQVLEKDPACYFAFSLCYDEDVATGEKSGIRLDAPRLSRVVSENPQYLLLDNFIRTPSTGIFRNDQSVWYDERMKWCVDYDMYLSLLLSGRSIYCIERPLVYIGRHPDQVTEHVIGDAAVVIKENVLLLNKLDGHFKLRVRYFDFYWRMMRNFEVRGAKNLLAIVQPYVPPAWFCKAAEMQSYLPQSLLRIGLFSKFSMAVCYAYLMLRRQFK